MPIGIINAMLRDKKDHYVTTIYKGMRKKFKILPESILILGINGKELVKIPTKSDFHITIPKRIVEEPYKKLEIKILGVFNKGYSLKRDEQFILDGRINLKSLIPINNLFGRKIYVLEKGDYLYVWYPVGGGVKHIKIRKFIEAEKLAELIGFYFGDGNTSRDIRSFRLNNCEASVLNYCLSILEKMGIKRNEFKVQIIYSTDKKFLSEDVKRRCVSYWAGQLKIDKEKIVSVNKSKNKRESLRYGSARIFLDNAVLVEILLHGVLNKILGIIKNPKGAAEAKILKGFLRGLAAAEGSVSLNKHKSLSRITLSFDPHSNELELYEKILSNLGITPKGVHGNELKIQKMSNFRVLKELEMFKMHEKRRGKFSLGYNNHKFS